MKKAKHKGYAITTLSKAVNKLSSLMAKNVEAKLFSDDGFLWDKPEKFWYAPIFTIKIPYPYIDVENNEYGEGRKGIFIGFYEIKIGKKKIINDKYKEEIIKWKKRKNSVYFINENNFKMVPEKRKT